MERVHARTTSRRVPTGTSAAEFMPLRPTLKSMRAAAQSCRGCPLYAHATQAVFGEGAARARLVLVGEQPGNEEDRLGHPFVGPAGRLLDEALAAAGIARSDTYVTNVVKHFKWEARGKRRLHKKPGAREIGACLPWLQKELELIHPEVVVLLGATAAQALLGRQFRVSVDRGRPISADFAGHALATVHPASLLRLPPQADRDRELRRFIHDLQVAASLLNASRPV
jgi:uracil-DNA glycosylase family protein